MIKTTIKVFDFFPQITERVERAVVEGLDEAAAEAARVAQANAKHRLEIRINPAHGDVDGYSAGIKSMRESDTDGKTTPIAEFFDEGTLGNRRKKLKRPRKKSWTVKRGDSTYTAQRHEIKPGSGIPAEHFFAKARLAARRKLLARLARLQRDL